MIIVKRDSINYALDESIPEKVRVESGAVIQVETYDCFENQITSAKDAFEGLDWERINPVSGPVFVVGAEVGDTLEVEIISIEVGNQIAMITGPGLGVMGDELKENTLRVYPIKEDHVIFDDLKIPLRKMIGVIGTAPKGEGIPSGVPDYHGGNMDCTEIAEGACLYLPVNVQGGLLFLGDLHAVMGDGEIAVCGGEVQGNVTLRVRTIKGNTLPLPSIVTREKVITISSKDTLDEAAVSATKNMVAVVQQGRNMTKEEATLLLSLVGDLRVCQIVDPKVTMRMEAPRQIFDDNPFV